MKVEPFWISGDGFQIRGMIHLPDRFPAPCIVCSHGLFSSKDSPKFVAMAEQLSREGLVAIRYDHRGCGESQGRIEDTTVSGRLDDLASVYGFARGHPGVNGKIGLMGSSMGGYISLLTAARHATLKPIVVWATPFQLRRKKGRVERDAYAPLGDSFFEDLSRYRLEEILDRVSHCLVVHGDHDELVPVWHARRIYAMLAEPKAIQVFSGADHRFSNAQHRESAIRLSAEFFKRYLR
jgi:alpha-beta hydrolase superfamily lysophospholipase